MSKRSFFAILFTAFFFFTGTAVKAQCAILSYNTLKAFWDNNAKGDMMRDLGFEVRSSNSFARCKIVMCSINDSISRNFKEFVFIYDDEVMYSFTDKDAYQKLKSEVMVKAEYAGFAIFDEFKREYYSDGKLNYCFYVGQRNCLSTKIPDYNVGFLQKLPSYVEKE